MKHLPLKGTIERMPDNFNKWVKDNAKRIERADERGTLPYFLRDNRGTWKGLVSKTKGKTIFKTELQKDEIRLNWRNRRLSRLAKTLPDEYAIKINSLIDKPLDFNVNAELSRISKSLLNDPHYSKYLEWFAMQSKSFGRLLNKFNNASGFDAFKQFNVIRQKASVIMRWNLRGYGLTKGMTYSHVAKDQIVGKTETRYIDGKRIDVKQYRFDEVVYKDKFGKTYSFEISSTPLVMRDAQYATKTVANMPAVLRNQFNGMRFMSTAHPLDTYFKVKYKNFTRGYMYSSDPISIHTATDKYNFERCLYHEIGHLVDNALQISNQSQWKFYQSGEASKWVTQYSKDSGSIREDFADSFSYYYMHRDWFKQYFPRRFSKVEAFVKQLEKRGVQSIVNNTKQPNVGAKPHGTAIYKSFDDEHYQLNSFNKNNGAYHVTSRERMNEVLVKKKRKGKNHAIKDEIYSIDKDRLEVYQKEDRICRVLYQNGHSIVHLPDKKKGGGGTYDGLLDEATKVDFKSLTSLLNITHHINKAINKQGADKVVLELSKNINRKQIKKIFNDPNNQIFKGKILYYYIGEEIIYYL